MHNDNKRKIQYLLEFKRLAIVFLCLVSYNLVCVWSIDCAQGKGYDTHLYISGILGLGNLIGKILRQLDIFHASSQINTFAMIFYLAINVLLLFFVSYRYLGNYFTVTTALAAIILPLVGLLINLQVKDGFLESTERFFGIFEIQKSFFNDFSRTLFAGIFLGIFNAIPIILKSSTGGIDIIAKYLAVYKKKDISFIIEIFGYAIMIIGVLATCIIELVNDNSLDYQKIFLSTFYTITRIKLSSLVIYIIVAFFQKPKTKLLTNIKPN